MENENNNFTYLSYQKQLPTATKPYQTIFSCVMEIIYWYKYDIRIYEAVLKPKACFYLTQKETWKYIYMAITRKTKPAPLKVEEKLEAV